MKKFFALICVLFIATVASGQESAIKFHEETPWSEIEKIALKEKKPVYVYCYTSWCGPCQGVKRNLFPVKEVGDFYNKNFICVKYDMELPAGLDFHKGYGSVVSRYPTHLYIDVINKEIAHKSIGMMSAAEFIADAQKSLEGRGLNYLQAQYDEGVRDFNTFSKYTIALYKSGKIADACALVYDYYQKNEKADSLMNQVKYDFYSFFTYRELDCQLVQDLIRKRHQLKQRRIAAPLAIDAALADVIQLNCIDFFRIEFPEDGSMPKLNSDQVKFNLLTVNLQSMSNVIDLQPSRVQMLVYNKLKAGRYEDAALTVKYAMECGINLSEIFQISTYKYIAVMCNDKKLSRRMIDEMTNYQTTKEKQFPNNNMYNEIAYMYKMTGDKKSAIKATEMYNAKKQVREKNHEKTAI